MPLIPTPGFFQRKAELYKQLGQLLANGVPPVQGLRTLGKLSKSSSVRRCFERKAELIERGEMLQDALFHGAVPQPDPLDKALVDAGERSGRLVEGLEFLDRYYLALSRVYRMVIGRLTYPFFIIHAAAFVLAVVAWFFANFDTGAAIRQFAIVLVPVYLLIFFGLYITFHNKLPVLRLMAELIYSKIPILGRALKSLHITRFTLALDSSLSAGIDIRQALLLSARTSGSMRLRSAMSRSVNRLEAGETISQVLGKCRFFPENFLVPIAVAEQSGQIDATLERLYSEYLEDSEIRMKQFGSTFSWVVYGSFVLFMVLSIFKIASAYFQELNSILG